MLVDKKTKTYTSGAIFLKKLKTYTSGDGQKLKTYTSGDAGPVETYASRDGWAKTKSGREDRHAGGVAQGWAGGRKGTGCARGKTRDGRANRPERSGDRDFDCV